MVKVVVVVVVVVVVDIMHGGVGLLCEGLGD